MPGPALGAPRLEARPPRRRPDREFFIARFDDGAREVMVEAQKEADSLKHNYVGTEHLMLALAQARGRGLDVTTRRASRSPSASARATSRGSPGLPRPFTPRAKRALEAALTEANGRRPRAVRPGRHPAGDRVRPEGTGGEVLAALGVTPEQLREQLGQ